MATIAIRDQLILTRLQETDETTKYCSVAWLPFYKRPFESAKSIQEVLQWDEGTVMQKLLLWSLEQNCVYVFITSTSIKLTTQVLMTLCDTLLYIRRQRK